MSSSVRSVPERIFCGLVFLWSASQRCLSRFISFLIAPPAQAWAPPSANTAHVSPSGRPSAAVGPWGVFKKACLCSPRNAGPTIHPGRWAQSLKSKEIQKIRSWRTLGYNSDKRMKYEEKILKTVYTRTEQITECENVAFLLCRFLGCFWINLFVCIVQISTKII